MAGADGGLRLALCRAYARSSPVGSNLVLRYHAELDCSKSTLTPDPSSAPASLSLWPLGPLDLASLVSVTSYQASRGTRTCAIVSQVSLIPV